MILYSDIGFDSKRNRVLIPLFTENELQFHDIKVAAAPGAKPVAEEKKAGGAAEKKK